MTLDSVHIPERIDYIGHGMIESASPTTSVGHVALHEGRHLSEFEARARREGRVVVAQDVDVHTELRNGVLVATSGKATAVLSARAQRSATSDGDAAAADAPAGRGESAEIEPKAVQADAARAQELERAAERVETALAQTTREVEQLEQKLQTEDEAAFEASAHRDEVAALWARQARLRAERARAQELTRGADQTARELLGAITSTNEVALGLSLLRFGARRPRGLAMTIAYRPQAPPPVLNLLV